MLGDNPKLNWAVESVYGQAPSEFIMPIIKQSFPAQQITRLFSTQPIHAIHKFDIEMKSRPIKEADDNDDFILSGAL